MATAPEVYPRFHPPFTSFDRRHLGTECSAELDRVSRLWFRCGYRPGIDASLNFFLLRDFITTPDTAYPPRFKTFKAMDTPFYKTDLFIRDVTDSGAKPTGGISNPNVREMLHHLQQRRQNGMIP
ncbi:MAG TPA: hypothetical protein VM222_01295 [Planctomycetota bacterium]|nr:hypothetical protein [Planctomycetota bacterium]